MQYQKNKNLFNLRKNIILRNKQKLDFNASFYQCIMTAFRAYSIVKQCYLLFFIASILLSLLIKDQNCIW